VSRDAGDISREAWSWGRGRSGGGGAPAANAFGWDNDLSGMPSLTYDSALSTNVTEAQMLAGMSVVNGAIRFDLTAIRAAGAGSGPTARGVLWIDAAALGAAPYWLYVDGTVVDAPTGTNNHAGHVGVALYYYAAAADASPSLLPSAGVGFTTGNMASIGLGTANTGSIGFSQAKRHAWSAAAFPGAGPHNGGWLNIMPLDITPAGWVRWGATYPPVTSSVTVANGRTSTNAGARLAPTHRLRMALIVEPLGLGTQLPTIDIRRVDAQWRPV